MASFQQSKQVPTIISNHDSAGGRRPNTIGRKRSRQDRTMSLAPRVSWMALSAATLLTIGVENNNGPHGYASAFAFAPIRVVVSSTFAASSKTDIIRRRHAALFATATARTEVPRGKTTTKGKRRPAARSSTSSRRTGSRVKSRRQDGGGGARNTTSWEEYEGEESAFLSIALGLDNHNNKDTANTSSSNAAWNVPPWLQPYYQPSDLTQNDDDLFPSLQLQDLEAALSRNGFSADDRQDILQTMVHYYYASATSGGATSLLLGMIDFVQLILEEHSNFQSIATEVNDDDDETEHKQQLQQPHMHMDVFASKPVILAGIVHYAECIAARQDAIYNKDGTVVSSSNNKLRLTSSTVTATSATVSPTVAARKRNHKTGGVELSYCEDDGSASIDSAQVGGGSARRRYPPNVPLDAKDIAASAATVKRAEILAHAFMGVGNTRRLTKEEAEGLRGLLLSSMEDWRALALRCVASLFRLEGILQQQQQRPSSGTGAKGTLDAFSPLLPGLRSREVVYTAQEAILVYATLAQRLGMHQLKAKIEGRAFQILYQRQYRAVSSVYRQSGEAMHTIRSFLSNEIDSLVREDESLMAHIDHLQVSSRVKEPYSFWKKMLTAKAKQQKENLLLNADKPSSSWSGSRTSNLSLAQVQDGIALRIILKAKKESSDEAEEATRAREKLLCYYVQHLIRTQFPSMDEDRVKDYIQYPKPNGYQSLHYTASLKYHTGQQFPFEVQVRSEEMHRIAEYGVAAHWDYKLASVLANQVGNSWPVFALEAAAEVVDKSPNVEVLEISEDAAMLEKDAQAVSTFAPDDDVVIDTAMVEDTHSSTTAISAIIQGGHDVTQERPRNNEQLEYIDALVNARQNLVQERVYVFVAGAGSLTLEQGQLVILDSGSYISDALHYMQEKAAEVLMPPVAEDPAMADDVTTSLNPAITTATSVPFVEPTVWRNGQLARLDETIRNGDVLLIEM